MFKNNALSLAVLVALGGLSLVGCGGSENASTSEEVINKTPTTSIDLGAVDLCSTYINQPTLVA
ncbi:MAG: hypothetical protein ACTJH9_15860, partial [Pseudoalteromonas sp.]